MSGDGRVELPVVGCVVGLNVEVLAELEDVLPGDLTQEEPVPAPAKEGVSSPRIVVNNKMQCRVLLGVFMVDGFFGVAAQRRLNWKGT